MEDKRTGTGAAFVLECAWDCPQFVQGLRQGFERQGLTVQEMMSDRQALRSLRVSSTRQALETMAEALGLLKETEQDTYEPFCRQRTQVFRNYADASFFTP